MRALRTGSVRLAGVLACLYLGSVYALGLADLTNRDAAQGIKGALTKGAASAVDKLGVAGGFLNNPKLTSDAHSGQKSSKPVGINVPATKRSHAVFLLRVC